MLIEDLPYVHFLLHDDSVSPANPASGLLF